MSQDRNRQLVAKIAEKTTPVEQAALYEWANQLLLIRSSEISAFQKAQSAVRLTIKGSIVWPAIKLMSKEVRKLGWDNRGWPARLGIGGAVVGAAVFGTQAAGIAALGSAIGVPLWVVVGSGAAFAGVIVDEFKTKPPVQNPGIDLTK